MSRFAVVMMVITLSLGIAVLAEDRQQARSGGTPMSLFDGKTFKGWEGNLASFRIEAGAIVGGTLKERIPRNEFLCTERTFSDFELRAQVKLTGAGANAGIQFRTKRIPNNHEVSGFQADMGEGWWGSLYDESRRNRVLAAADKALIAKILKPEDWNDYVIRAEGNHIQLFLNGSRTVDYTETEAQIERSGVIAVQIHGGGPSEARYRNITIVDLSK